MNRPSILAIIVSLSILAALGIVGKIDADDAATDQIAYCANVADGTWPDFEGTYKKYCPKVLRKTKKTR